jgi:hypothetical protein
MSITKLIIVVVLASIAVSLSLYSKFVTPLALLAVALYSFYLENKIKKTLESSKNLEETVSKLTNDVNTLFENQKQLLTIINSLRARINNYYGKTTKKQDPSISEKLRNIERREKEGANDVAFVRFEQLYPFPQKQVDAILKKYAKASELIWVQEEPENSGAWRHVDHAMRKLNLTYVGRDEGASPATGFSKKHNEENEEIMRKIFSKVLVK